MSYIHQLTGSLADVLDAEHAAGGGKDEFAGVGVEVVLGQTPGNTSLPLGEKLFLLALFGSHHRRDLEQKIIVQ